MKKRIALWDNVKFFLITAVVIGHLIDWFTDESDFARSVFLFIYIFHMPLFIFISGLFYSNRNIKSKCLFYISVGFALKIVMGFYSFLNGTGFYFSLLEDGGIPWFMFVLAIYTFIMYYLRDMNKFYLLGGAIVLACFVGYDASIGDYLYLSRTIVFFPFFLLGVILDAEKISSIKKKYTKLIYPALVVLVVIGLICLFQIDHIYLYRYLFTGRNSYYPEIMDYAPLARLGCYICSFIMGAAIIFIVPSCEIPLISKMGSNSVDVYFWHYIIYSILEKYTSFSKLFYMGGIGKIAFILIGCGIVVISAQGGIFSFPLKQIKKLCFLKKA